MSASFNRRLMSRMRADVQRRQGEILDAARAVMSDAVRDGALATQDNLENAITNTGLQRLAVFEGFPGRHDTGNMVASVNYEGEDGQPYEVDGDVEVFAFGWFPGEFQDYFYDQDVGEGNIPPARALEGAYAAAIKQVRQRMGRAVKAA